MSNIPQTVTRTLKISAGEQAILPPGATIVSATGQLVSSCNEDIVISEMTCYAIAVANTKNDGSETDNLSTMVMEGFLYNGIKYPFSNPVNVSDERTAIAGFLSGTPNINNSLMKANFQNNSAFGGIILNLCVDLEQYEGSTIYYQFKTLDTIASKLSIYGYATTGNSGNGTGFTNIPISFPTVTVEEMKGRTDHPEALLTNCPCS